jgi:hypothetical protein
LIAGFSFTGNVTNLFSSSSDTTLALIGWYFEPVPKPIMDLALAIIPGLSF